jgi:hypothetical protein
MQMSRNMLAHLPVAALALFALGAAPAAARNSTPSRPPVPPGGYHGHDYDTPPYPYGLGQGPACCFTPGRGNKPVPK